MAVPDIKPQVVSFIQSRYQLKADPESPGMITTDEIFKIDMDVKRLVRGLIPGMSREERAQLGDQIRAVATDALNRQGAFAGDTFEMERDAEQLMHEIAATGGILT
jgi:hypothetical protein